MKFTDSDIDLICKLYRDAKDKDVQIEILCQLYVSPVTDIKQVLATHGLIGDDGYKRYIRFATLYRKGLNDYEIAIKARATPSEVRTWRVLNKLKPNVDGGKKCKR